jgi:hypothetical protein
MNGQQVWGQQLASESLMRSTLPSPAYAGSCDFSTRLRFKNAPSFGSIWKLELQSGETLITTVACRLNMLEIIETR